MSYTEKKELLDTLSAMVSQHCDFDDEVGTIPQYHSGYITANAAAMRVLENYGRMRLIKNITHFKDGDTRLVYGEFI